MEYTFIYNMEFLIQTIILDLQNFNMPQPHLAGQYKLLAAMAEHTRLILMSLINSLKFWLEPPTTSNDLPAPKVFFNFKQFFKILLKTTS